MLELMVLGADGRFAASSSIPRHWAQTTGLGSGTLVRVPLILAVRNTGNRPSPPTYLDLSLPTRYRLSRSDGRSLPAESLPGTPMVRYRIEVPATRAAAGTIAGYLPVLDTLWLEPIIPSFYCIALSDSVPDFVPSPPAPVEAIAQVRIFYSFTGEDLKHRQTGLLAVQLDPVLLRQQLTPPPPVFPTEYHDPEVPRPALATLEYSGSQQVLCGDPQSPMEILSTLWETPGGGRFFVLDYGGAPRKYLFDLNRDSIIELEIWDASGSGNFNARRQARLPIPAFLLPASKQHPFDASIYATMAPEQLLALNRYGTTAAGPYHFQTRAPESKPRTNRFRPGSTGDDDALEQRSGLTIRYWSDPALAPEAGDPRSAAGQTQIAPGAGTQPAPAPGRPAAPSTSQPPTLGRPVAPHAQPPALKPPPVRSGEEPAKPTQKPRPEMSEPVPAKPDNPAKPDKPGPKVLGKPLDGNPPRPRPDTTGEGR
jgi:hypothetical protein